MCIRDSSKSGVTVSKDNQANDGRSGTDADNIRPDIERFYGSPFNDLVFGSDDNVVERYVMAGGDDFVAGNGGPDMFEMLHVDDGSDLYVGGAGFDTALYADRTEPVTVNLSAGGADDGYAGEGDELREIEAAAGGKTNDVLRANVASTTAVQLNGNAGNDIITGTNADAPCCGTDDTLIGGAGRDTITALAGEDAILVQDGESASCP